MPDAASSLVERGKLINAKKDAIVDHGRRRYVCLTMDWDTRATVLTQKIEGHLEESIRKRFEGEKKKLVDTLRAEFGEKDFGMKLLNFIQLDSRPLSILAHHNQFFKQVRQAYVLGAYYPALVAACALGERILNHLIIDLREFYSAEPEYKDVHRKKSFDKWDLPIDTLLKWGVLLPDVGSELRELKSIRNRSIHFNVETYGAVKDDALSAIMKLRTVISRQFGTLGDQPWFIKGTKGHKFISREWENQPFIQTYFLPNASFVGPYFSLELKENRWQPIDFPNYGMGDWSDEEFAHKFNECTPEERAPTAGPIAD